METFKLKSLSAPLLSPIAPSVPHSNDPARSFYQFLTLSRGKSFDSHISPMFYDELVVPTPISIKAIVLHSKKATFLHDRS
jgi:hypothetical protein